MEYCLPMLPPQSTHSCLAISLVAFFAVACSDDSDSAVDAATGSIDSALAIDANNNTVDAQSQSDGGSFGIVSSAYNEGGAIPTKHSCNGDNVSPALMWGNAPDNTQSFAVVLLDKNNNLTHSVIWDIPSSRSELPENIEKVFEPSNVPGAKQPNSYLSSPGYAGPCPGSMHTYEFRLYALSVATLPGLSESSSKAAVVTAIEAASITSVALTGTYTP